MLIGFSLLSLLLSRNIHALLSGLPLNWSPLVCVQDLTIPPILRWFLMLEGLSILAVAWMLFGREHIQYRSKMIEVVPGEVFTPQAEGQGQYGTARWMTEKELKKAFTAVTVDSHAALLERLLEEAEMEQKGVNASDESEQAD